MAVVSSYFQCMSTEYLYVVLFLFDLDSFCYYAKQVYSGIFTTISEIFTDEIYFIHKL